MRIIAWFFLAVFSLYLTGCATRYRLIEDSTSYYNRYVKNPDYNKWVYLDYGNHIIVHHGDLVHEMNAVNYNNNSNTISGTYRTVPEDVSHTYSEIKRSYYNTRKLEANISKTAVRQVHFFVSESEISEDKMTFSLNDVKQIDRLKPKSNAGITALTVTGGIIGGIALFVAIACNCPHVYIDNGNGLVMENTLYTGAIAKQLERYDYKIIPDHFPRSDQFQMVIVNEEKEDQFTNDLDLIVVEHDEDLQIVTDQHGNIFGVKETVQPSLAINEMGTDLINSINSEDEIAYAFNADSISGLTYLETTFNKPSNASEGNLILTLKNTQWSGFVYNQFKSLFGHNYAKWVEMNKDLSKEEREKWMHDQGMRLRVEIKTEAGWKEIEEIDFTGEAVYNKIAVPLTNLEGKSISVRLTTGFQLWEVDYAAMDFLNNTEPFKVHYLSPASAKDENGQDRIAGLLADDENYLEHLQGEPSIKVLFDDLPVSADFSRTLIIRSKGYYEGLENYEGKTQRARIKEFANPGEFSRFSKELYDQYQLYLSGTEE